MICQFIREGDFEPAKALLEGACNKRLGVELEQDYLDALGKYLVEYALYLQCSGDRDYFNDELMADIKHAAHSIMKYRNTDDQPGHSGIMQKSNTLDNGLDFLVVDNFSTLHGLVAYKYICESFADEKETAWAQGQMQLLNKSFNQALDFCMERRGVDWYMASFDDDIHFWKRGYDGNWLGTTLMMSTFPYDAMLQGMDLEGTWKQAFDRTIENSIELRDKSDYDIPPRSWGAWWGHEYGTPYNAGMALQMMFSEKHRTHVIESLEFLLDNQSSPYQWGESFDRGLNEDDWTAPAADYESWALGFIRQALLEACISVKTDGQLIIGRAIPDRWMTADSAIEWKDVRINGGKKLDFRIESQENYITLSLDGDRPDGDIVFNLPLFVENITEVIVDGNACSSYDNSLGTITAQASAKNIKVAIRKNVTA